MPLILFTQKKKAAVVLSQPLYDPYWSSVVLLMHMEDDQLIDEVGHVVKLTTNSTAKLSELSKYGNGSYAFNGTSGSGGGLTCSGADFVLGSGDFTVEAFTRINNPAYGGGNVIVSNGNSTAFWQLIYREGALSVHTSNGGWVLTGNVPQNTDWHHIAWTNKSGTHRLFFDGKQIAAGVITPLTFVTSYNLYIGCNHLAGNTALNGNLDEVRITKGVARYIADFTVPTAAFPQNMEPDFDPYWNSVVSLVHGGQQERINVLYDEEKGAVGTKNGQIIPAYNTPLTNAVGSAFFDGLVDLIQFPYKSTYGLTGNLTIEFWLYPTPTNFKVKCVLSTRNGNSTGGYSIYWDPSLGNITLKYWSSILVALPATANGSVPANTWTHVAIVKSGDNYDIYINGQASVSSASTMVCGVGSSLTVGRDAVIDEYYEGCLTALRISNASIYSAPFTPPTTALSTSPSTAFLMNFAFNGVYDNTTLLDSAQKRSRVFTNSNPVSIGSVSPFATGGSVHYFRGTTVESNSAPYSTDFDMGTSDFTIEAWFNTDNFGGSGGQRGVVVALGNGQIYGPWSIMTYVDSGGRNIVQFFCISPTNMISGVGMDGAQITTVGSSLSTNTWYHIAVVRKGSTFTSYLNGVQQVTWTSALSVYRDTASGLAVGCSYDRNKLHAFSGYISNVRISKSAIYTANFTPSTQPLTALASTTVLLLCDSAPMWDGTRRRNWKPVADAGVSKKHRMGVSSMNLMQTSSYYWTKASDDFDFGTGDITIECWFYLTAWNTSNIHRIWSTDLNSAAQFVIANPSSYSYGFDALGVTVTYTMPFNTWVHLAATRQNGLVRLFVNGKLLKSATNAVAIGSSTSHSRIGSLEGWDRGLQGYVDEFRITKGVSRYSSNFSPRSRQSVDRLPDAADLTNLAPVVDTDFAYDLVIMPLVDSATDYKSHAVTATSLTFGAPTLFGANSCNLGVGYAQIISVEAFGTADFTMECWINPTQVQPATAGYITIGAKATGSAPIFGYQNSTTFGIALTGGAWVLTTNTLPPLNQWSHVAVSRYNETLMLFINGVLVNSVANISNFLADKLWLGHPNITNSFKGYISNFRMSCFSRYRGNFNVPQQAFPNVPAIY